MNEQNPYTAPQTNPMVDAGPQPPMSVKDILFSFRGRINRAKYWGYSILLSILAGVAMIIVFGLLGAVSETSEMAVNADGTLNTDIGSSELSIGSIIGLLALVLVYIFTIWSSLAIAAKRWHDRDKSGWMSLVYLIPLVGPLWMLIECGFLRGTAGPNSYGGDPLR